MLLGAPGLTTRNSEEPHKESSEPVSLWVESPEGCHSGLPEGRTGAGEAGKRE